MPKSYNFLLDVIRPRIDPGSTAPEADTLPPVISGAGKTLLTATTQAHETRRQELFSL